VKPQSSPANEKGRTISTWLTEAAYIHTPLLQWFNIRHPPGKAFKQIAMSFN